MKYLKNKNKKDKKQKKAESLSLRLLEDINTSNYTFC